MKTRRNLFQLCLLATVLALPAIVKAQSTFNYYVTSAGGSNSRVTWNATGSLTALPGVAWTVSGQQFGGVPIQTMDIFNNSYAGISFPQSIPTTDGSYYHNTELAQNYAINLYYAGVNGRFDTFGLVCLPATTALGQHITYDAAGTQSVIIPIPYSDFIAGTHQSTWAAGTFFDTSVTVNLTVGAVPEPSSLALTIVSGLALLLRFHRRK